MYEFDARYHWELFGNYNSQKLQKDSVNYDKPQQIKIPKVA